MPKLNSKKVIKNDNHKIENFMWLLNRSGIDIDLIFKDKSTGEYFLFDRKGYWDAEGLNHKLIN
jgi:hypothetical protein